MSNRENNDLLLQYMRVVVRQQEGILEAMNSLQRQNNNLSSVLSQELTRRNNNSILESNNSRRTYTTTRPRTRQFFTGSLPSVRERNSTYHRMAPTPRIVTNYGESPVNTHTRATDTISEAILNATMNASPVRIRPSATQIRRATRLSLFRDISNTTQTIICPIDRELLMESDGVMQVIHCGHFFREHNLRRHFRNNTRCPLCRYDIRDYIPTNSFFFNTRDTSRPVVDVSANVEESSTTPSVYDNITNPFVSLPSGNINPTHQTTREIQTIIDESIGHLEDSSSNRLQG
jgi:hypothetical protein